MEKLNQIYGGYPLGYEKNKKEKEMIKILRQYSNLKLSKYSDIEYNKKENMLDNKILSNLNKEILITAKKN